jgi:hypothetical protein
MPPLHFERVIIPQGKEAVRVNILMKGVLYIIQ